MLVTPLFAPQIGGVQEYLAAVCRALGPERVAVVVSGPLPNDGVHAQAPLQRNAPEWFDVLRVPQVRRLRSLLALLSTAAMVRRRDSGVLVGWAGPTALAGLVAARLRRRPCVLFCYGKELLSSSRWQSWCTRVALRRADHVITISALTTRLAINAGAEGVPMTVLHPPVRATVLEHRRTNIGEADAYNGSRVVLTVGRLVRRKGHDTVIRALAALGHRFNDVVYVVVGDGPERASLERLAAECDVADRVVFAGALSLPEMVAWYRRADVFAMVSRQTADDVEGFGIVYAEASATGLPVIGSKGTGAADAIRNGVTGLLVPPEDVTELATALSTLLDDPDLRSRLGSAGSAWVRAHLTEDAFAAQLHEALGHVARERQACRRNGEGPSRVRG